MNIKTEIVSEEEEAEDEYPMMMISGKGTIVYFTAKSEGIFILGHEAYTGNYKLYESSKTWVMDNFRPFKGSFITTCS